MQLDEARQVLGFFCQAERNPSEYQDGYEAELADCSSGCNVLRACVQRASASGMRVGGITLSLTGKDTMSLGRATALQRGTCLVATLLSNMVLLIFFPSAIALHYIISPFPPPGQQLSEEASPYPQERGVMTLKKGVPSGDIQDGLGGMGWRGVRNERWEPIYMKHNRSVFGVRFLVQEQLVILFQHSNTEVTPHGECLKGCLDPLGFP
ncbi:unnamed protein product [Bubo scandiacus]